MSSVPAVIVSESIVMLGGVDALLRVSRFPGELSTASNVFVMLLFGIHVVTVGLQDHSDAVVQLPEPVDHVAVTAPVPTDDTASRMTSVGLYAIVQFTPSSAKPLDGAFANVPDTVPPGSFRIVNMLPTGLNPFSSEMPSCELAPRVAFPLVRLSAPKFAALAICVLKVPPV